MTHKEQELETALLAILGDFKTGEIDFKQAVKEINQAAAYHKESPTTADASVFKEALVRIQRELYSRSGITVDPEVNNMVDEIIDSALAQYSTQSLPESQESKGGEAEEYITQDQYRKMAEGLDKPALKLIKDAGVPFEKWADNIQALIQKELGLEKTIVYKRVTKK